MTFSANYRINDPFLHLPTAGAGVDFTGCCPAWLPWTLDKEDAVRFKVERLISQC